jgi:methyl-accepting chemotaxis protein
MKNVRKGLSARLLAPTIAIVLTMMLLFGWIAAHMLESEIRKRAAEEVTEQTARIFETFSTLDGLSSESVHSAMRVLLREAGQFGSPQLGDSTVIAGQNVPDLKLGKTSQSESYDLVDRVKGLMGGTATLFVRRGNDFVRVSTNVMKADGSRAVGTLLDSKGKAWAALNRGEAFYGVVDILGKPYMTGYEPIRDGQGTIIGAWYVGYPLSTLGSLRSQIESTRILDHGFIVLLRGDGSIIFKPDQISPEAIQDRISRRESNSWAVFSSSYDKWNYTLLAAYPQADVSGQVHRMQGLIILCTILMAILVVAVLYAILNRLVLRPVQALIQQMENADLNTVLREDRKDEIGTLARAFDNFIAQVRQVWLEVANVSEQLAGAAGDLSGISNVQAESAEKQSSQAGQVVVAMQEMSSTVENISQSSSKAAEAARQAVDTAHTGGAVVAESVASMKSLISSAGKTSQQIESLGRHSQEIGRITAVIDEIAKQTNLLALNAAIEAARAGEQGRGFAVVAGEVRRLAERTTGATGEIARMVTAIQKETQLAVEAMSLNTAEVEKGSQTTQEAVERLKQIIRMADQVGGMISQIAAAANEQSVTALQVNSNVDQIAALVKESASEAQHAAEACGNLSGLAQRLQELVAQFQLKSNQQSMQPVLSRNMKLPDAKTRNAAVLS